MILEIANDGSFSIDLSDELSEKAIAIHCCDSTSIIIGLRCVI